MVVWRNGSGSSESRLQWFDRNGKKLGAVGEAADFSSPALSPDERKLAVGIMDPQTKTRDIWVIDLVRGTRTRLTFDPADDLNPVWSPDGTRIAFTSNRKGERDIYQKPADGSGQEELLLEGKDGQKNLEDWSPDGKYLLYNHQPARQYHLYVMPFEGDRKPDRLPEDADAHGPGAILSQWAMAFVRLDRIRQRRNLRAGLQA